VGRRGGHVDLVLHGVAAPFLLRGPGLETELVEPAGGGHHTIGVGQLQAWQETRAELLGFVSRRVENVPDDYRSAVTLVDLDNRTHHAAAEVTGISTSGMKSRVQRGRKRLAALLQDCCAIETSATGSITDFTPHSGPCSC
jgi:RNA polymerase sigma-70 factor (ECF subfamily)